MSSPESQAWEALKGAFAGLLRDQRTGRPIEELVLYLADLTTQHGRALAQALHAAKLLPDPAVLLNPERQRMCVGVMTAKDMVSVATSAGPLLEQAAVDLGRVPPPRHIRVLVAAEETRVDHLYDLALCVPTGEVRHDVAEMKTVLRVVPEEHGWQWWKVTGPGEAHTVTIMLELNATGRGRYFLWPGHEEPTKYTEPGGSFEFTGWDDATARRVVSDILVKAFGDVEVIVDPRPGKTTAPDRQRRLRPRCAR